ncbi:uncharacterized protein [Triticum aestivum]|uniref:uncharacterized protein isoform X2 n=1 Tax=Triticum aestivum TaxID=4565 RepID=UPI001D01D896|nr:uncharacterized protein LOC123155788 isoform X2 [Triticum aestivum]
MDHEVLVHILDGREKPTNLPFTLLKNITENFSDDREIGHGGFAIVYKGVLPNGSDVAVKRIRSTHSIKETLFYRELDCLLNTEHKNVVRFLGYCANTEQIAIQIEGLKEHVYAELRERLLCFEYISNGSLYITDELRGFEWNTRYEIIKGICEDNDMVPKITDFGLSRLDEKSQTMSNDRFRSLGYCAPEYAYEGKMSFKSDMYSLGCIIIELVTGQREVPNKSNVLRRWRHRWKKTGKETPLVSQQVAKCLEIGLQCQEIDPSKRPYMWDMIHITREIEGANGKISNADENTSRQICPYSEGDMLRIEPLELHFPLEVNKQMACTLRLSNGTGSYIAFIVENLSGLQYSTQQPKGLMPPQSKCNVEITVQLEGKAQKYRHHTNELTVWSTKVNDCYAVEDITISMFLKEVVNVVDQVNLDVVFDAEPQEASGKTSEVSPYMKDDMLGIEPLELHFPFQLNKEISSSVELSNETGAYIAFNIKTTSPLPYCTEPNKGVVLPWSKCIVTITLQSQHKAPEHMQQAYAFILQSTKVKDGLAAEDISTDMFKVEGGNMVDEVNLDVVLMHNYKVSLWMSTSSTSPSHLNPTI